MSCHRLASAGYNHPYAQRMSEGQRTDIVRRLPCEVGISLPPERRGQGSCRGRGASAWIKPRPVPSANQRAVPQANCVAPQAKLGTVETMLHTSLSAKKRHGELKLFTAPLCRRKRIAATPRKNR